jgi:hypothetical protein
MTGVDWDRMSLDISERYLENDDSLYLVHNFTDIRAEMDVKFNGGKNIANDSIAEAPQDYKTGQHILYEDTSIREFHFIVNGAYTEAGKMEKTRKMTAVAHRCKGGKCPEFMPVISPIEKTPRFWSKVEAWSKTKVIPIAGENLIIESGWNMHLDLKETPIFDKIEINGRLTFVNDKDIHLRAKKILIRGGELRIGTKEKPYLKNGKITLYGMRNEPTIAL